MVMAKFMVVCELVCSGTAAGALRTQEEARQGV